ncbi:MAG: AMIN domain-containing protein [Ruminococcaceae bacterium]|nr:AMIN domain-containing protein [Oscillospiraceae bacterium]
MKKRLLCVCLIFLLSVSLTAQGMTLYYDGELHEHDEVITLKVNGTLVETDVPPVIINDRTFIPSRGLFEKLGAVVDWESAARRVIINYEETEVILTVDSTNATVNGENVTMDVPAKIVNDRAMIPIRFVSEHLGLQVGWDGDSQTVTIHQEFRYTISRISYSEKKHRVTVVSNEPIVNVEDDVLGKNRIVIDFPGAKMESGKGKIDIENSVLKQIRWSQFQLVPYIGRLVIESKESLTYEITYSYDKKQMYVELTNLEELDTLDITPSPTMSPTPAKTPAVTAKPTKTPTPTAKPSSKPPQVSAVTLNEDAKDLLVVIDPGHGGYDVGAVGRADGSETYEKDINLAISLKANEMLSSAGVKTYLTRETDVEVDLFARPVIANRLNAALFLSVHNNAFSTETANGTTVLYYPDGQPDKNTPMTSQRFAQILQEELVDALDRRDRGITNGSEMAVIRGAVAPAVITEIAFITNPTELELLKTEEFQNSAAEALCRAVIRALNEMTS